MARIRRTYAKKSGPKNNVWTAVTLANVVVSTTTIEVDIVDPDEWQPATTGFEHATLLRIRGWLSLSRNETNDASGTMFMMIYVTDEDDGVHDPSLPATYNTEDVIWTSGCAFSSQQASSLEVGPTIQLDVDVKAMRKIDSSRQVRLALVATSNNLVLVGGVLRALVRKS